MLFKPNELGEQITAAHLKQITDANREDRHAYYSRRYAMYKGIATDPNEPEYDVSLCQSFFPKGKNETPEEYAERMKVWIPQGRIIIERLADMCINGGVEYKFVAINPEDSTSVTMAENATANFNADLEYNNWELVSRERILEPLAIGQISDWLDYRRHDPKTGVKFDNGGRIKYVKRWPWFAEPVVHPDNVTEIIGACYIYRQENEVISPAVSLQMNLSGDNPVITELWLDPSYNADTGKKIALGAYVRLRNESIDMPEEKAEWVNDNKYKTTPVVFYQSIDIDESQYNGESYFDRFVDSLIKLCRVASSEVSGVQYIINQRAIVASPEATPKELPHRHNADLKIPQGEPQSTIQNMPRNLDLSPEQSVKKYLTIVIGQAGNYSVDLMDIDGIGKVAQSGIARKIVYTPTVIAVNFLRKNFAKSVKELMTKSLIVKEYENGGTLEGIDRSKIRPEVVFYGSVMPADETEELKNDIEKLKNKLIDRKGLVMKYNDEVNTDEDAVTLMEEIDKEQPEQPAKFPFEARRPRGTGNAPNENQNA